MYNFDKLSSAKGSIQGLMENGKLFHLNDGPRESSTFETAFVN